MTFTKRATSMFVKMGVALFLFLLLACDNQSSQPSITAPFSNPFLVVLGTAQDAGYPQLNCKKVCCQQVWSGKRESVAVSCLGIADPQSNQYWLIDATPSIVEQCQQMEELMPGSSLAGVFLTHAHIGHYTGLMMLGREAMGAQKVPTYVMPRMKQFLSDNGPWSQLVALENISLVELKAEQGVRLTEDLSVEAFLVPHRDEFSETVGYKINGKNQRALFIPDIDKWEKWNKNIKDEIALVDYAFLDGTFYQAGEIPGRDMKEIPHPFIEESMRYFNDLNKSDRQKVFFIHLNHTNPLLWSADYIDQFKQSDYGLAKVGQQVSL